MYMFLRASACARVRADASLVLPRRPTAARASRVRPRVSVVLRGFRHAHVARARERKRTTRVTTKNEPKSDPQLDENAIWREKDEM